MPLSFRNARRSISKLRPFKRRSTRSLGALIGSLAVPPVITTQSGSLHPNDNGTNYALISPLGSVDGDRGTRYSYNGFDGSASIESEIDTSEDEIRPGEPRDISPDVVPIDIDTAQEERAEDTDSINTAFVILDATSHPKKQPNNAASIESEIDTTEVEIRPGETDAFASDVVPVDIDTAQEERVEDADSINAAFVTFVAVDTTSPIPVEPDMNNYENSSPNGRFVVGECVRVVKRGHKNFGAYGKIQRTTKCYVFFFDESKKATVQIASTSVERFSDSIGSSPTVINVETTAHCDVSDNSTASVKGVNGGGPCEDFGGVGLSAAFSPNSNPKKRPNRRSSPMIPVADDMRSNVNSSPNGRFVVGECVRVVKKGHKNFGAYGKIQRTTKCYVFFFDESKKATVQIASTSVERHSVSNGSSQTVSTVETAYCDVSGNSTASVEGVNGGGPCEDFGGVGLSAAFSPNSNPEKRPNRRSSPMIPVADDMRSNVNSSPNGRFVVGECVRVVKKGHKNFGAYGKIQRTTKCYVYFFDESEKATVQIASTSVERHSVSNGSSQTVSTVETVYCDVSGSSIVSDEGVNGGGPCEGFAGVGLSAAVSLGLSIEKICFGSSKKMTNAFSNIWGVGNYLPPIEISLESNDNPDDLQLKLRLDNKDYALYHAEVSEDKTGSLFTKSKKVTAHYVCSENLRDHEENQADFGTLSSAKTWARRGLYLSPAMKLNREYAVKNISGSDLTMIDDVGTVGCGFISSKYLEDLLGNDARAKRALGIQIRIFVPTYGVFKGMLMRKNIIGEPIQLNTSLRKVAPSRSKDASDDGYIVIKNVFPSSDNFIIGRKFLSSQDPNKKRLKPITELKGFKKSLTTAKSCKISSMHVRLLTGLGVAALSLEQYSRNYKKDPEKLCHTHLVGMADPTNKLPPNSVFITGMTGSIPDELFITRSPCLEATDGRVIKVVRTKPDGMENDDWNFLQSLTFGAVIFGDPKQGDRSLPELIADGDLDGDLYFVCWDETVVSQIRRIPITDDERFKPPEHDGGGKYDPEWFSKAQTFISQIPKLHIGIDRLVCLFYNECIQRDDIEDPDAVCFARSFKQALDVKKEGDLIFLPRHLWTVVPEKLQKYLTADNTALSRNFEINIFVK
ncbi:hypothetical protein ACHAXA_002351 [Cyclostephanos tholiformis]|uniref:RNA-dependent RNA polymerase n=1 Tax=Cyclostephanos tholiformis TaxID=382380 RepID=A0ABD3SRW0_9STRA